MCANVLTVSCVQGIDCVMCAKVLTVSRMCKGIDCVSYVCNGIDCVMCAKVLTVCHVCTKVLTV